MIRVIRNGADLVRLFPLAIKEGNAVGYDTSRLNPEKLWNTLKACMDHAAIFISEEGDEITGMMAIIKIESYWSDDFTLTNLIYWVDPEHRKSRAGIELLIAARNYAQGVGLQFDLRVESTEDLERKHRFFKRHGFTHVGGNYQYRS